MEAIQSFEMQFDAFRERFSDLLWQGVERFPKTLYFLGRQSSLALFDELPERGLAVVGTRLPQPRSVEAVRGVIGTLRGTRLIIISGFARGIDSEAHRSALRAELPTIAVLGGGADVPYPRQNLRLRDEILGAGGLLISEFPHGTEPLPYHFLQRNRLIAAWAKATWVVQAPRPSGALSTAKFARDMHRDLYATPSFPGDVPFAGNQKLLDDDHAIPIWGAHNLGRTWLPIAARVFENSSSDRELLPHYSFRDEKQRGLFDFVTAQTLSRGSCPLSGALDWSISLGWIAAEFFETMQILAESGAILKCGDVLISRQNESA